MVEVSVSGARSAPVRRASLRSGCEGHVPRMFLEVLQNFSVDGQSIVAPDVNGSRKDTCPPLSRTGEPRPFFPLRPGRLPHTDSYIYVKSEVLPTA